MLLLGRGWLLLLGRGWLLLLAAVAAAAGPRVAAAAGPRVAAAAAAGQHTAAPWRLLLPLMLLLGARLLLLSSYCG